jgi:hypothetical protein
MHVVGDTGRLHALTEWRPNMEVEVGISRAIEEMHRNSKYAEQHSICTTEQTGSLPHNRGN